VEDVRRLAGRPRALQISTAYHDVTRPDETLDPAFRARERRDFQAVYQALPLCIVAALQGYAEAYEPSSHMERQHRDIGAKARWWPQRLAHCPRFLASKPAL
jgi:hypothetical protein